MDISTRFMGLLMPNPVMVASSSLTANLSGVKEAVSAGAGAVVLKSLFEEDITAIARKSNEQNSHAHSAEIECMERVSMLMEPDAYITFVEEAALEVDVPVIASLNCHSANWWVDYAERIANVGADAIELNLSPLSRDIHAGPGDLENEIIGIVSLVRETVSLPLAVKLGPACPSLPNLSGRLENAGAKALTLFNRFHNDDIDIENMVFKSGNVFSSSRDFETILRWLGIISDMTEMDIAASTGLWDSVGLIKAILAGADVAQLCSVLYQRGPGSIGKIIDGLKNWMKNKKYENLDDFRGRLSYKNGGQNHFYTRIQYVRELEENIAFVTEK